MEEMRLGGKTLEIGSPQSSINPRRAEPEKAGTKTIALVEAIWHHFRQFFRDYEWARYWNGNDWKGTSFKGGKRLDHLCLQRISSPFL